MTVIFPIFHSFTTNLLPLELVQLNQKIVYVLQMLYFVYLFKLVNKGKSGDKENVYLDIELIAKKLDSFWLILFHIKDIEIDISKVDNKQI